MVVEGDPVHDGLARQLSSGEPLAVFNRPHRLSVGSVSQQLPFRDVELRMSQALRVSWKLWLQYWLSLSLWKISPAAGPRLKQAISKASLIRVVGRCGCRLHPTT